MASSAKEQAEVAARSEGYKARIKELNAILEEAQVAYDEFASQALLKTTLVNLTSRATNALQTLKTTLFQEKQDYQSLLDELDTAETEVRNLKDDLSLLAAQQQKADQQRRASVDAELARVQALATIAKSDPALAQNLLGASPATSIGVQNQEDVFSFGT